VVCFSRYVNGNRVLCPLQLQQIIPVIFLLPQPKVITSPLYLLPLDQPTSISDVVVGLGLSNNNQPSSSSSKTTSFFSNLAHFSSSRGRGHHTPALSPDIQNRALIVVAVVTPLLQRTSPGGHSRTPPARRHGVALAASQRGHPLGTANKAIEDTDTQPAASAATPADNLRPTD
jgi:hypothetical protein